MGNSRPTAVRWDVKPLVSLYDLALSFATDGNPYLTGMDFTNTRFTRDIYPILESMLLSAQVFASSYDDDNHIHYRTNYFHDAGTSPYTTIKSSGFDIPGPTDPIRALYFSRLTPPDSPDLKQDRFGMYPNQVISLSSDQSALETTNPRLLDIGNDPDEPVYKPKYMPKLFSLALTHLQFNHMKNWVDGNFVNDFVADPRIPQAHSPDPWKIDLAHMGSISGGSFFPGIEVGSNAWNKELWKKFLLAEKMKLLHFNRDPLVRLDTKKISEGTLTSTLGCPWQADYMACDDYWWPASRPISLLTDPNDPSGLIYRWHPPAPTPDAAQFVWEGLGYMQLLDTPPYSGRVVERERTARVPAPQQPVIHP
jgi:L-lysine epsilon oxidase C-terminal domain